MRELCALFAFAEASDAQQLDKAPYETPGALHGPTKFGGLGMLALGYN